MKILILGGSGMLGHKLIEILSQNHEVFATYRAEVANYEKYEFVNTKNSYGNIDVLELDKVENVVAEVEPDFVLNAIGLIKQKKDSKNYISSLKINSLLPHQFAEICNKFGAKLVTFSTDCVFDGAKGNYLETDEPNATDLYGKTKELGEVTGSNHITLRTSIIGRELSTSHSLIEWFLSNCGKRIKGYTKAIYSGFPTIEIADILENFIFPNNNLKGLWHVSSEPINKFELLTLLKQKLKLDIEIEPFDDFAIDRSLNSERFQKETGYNPPSWDKLVNKMILDFEKYDVWRNL